MGGPPPGPPLDSAPVAPTPPGPGAPPLVVGRGAATADPQAAAKQEAQRVLQLGTEIDRALLALAQVAGAGAKEIGQARQLIAAGLAKYAAEKGDLGATNPTALGNSFPGGGFGSNR